MFLMPLTVNLGRDLRRHNFRASAPEDVGVANGNADGFEVLIDRRFVLQDFILLGAVDDAHDVDVPELRASFAPVGVGHAVVATDFASGFHFATFGDGPVEEAVEAGDTFSSVGGFDVLEKGREAADHFLAVEDAGDLVEAFQADACDFGAGIPAICNDFVRGELFFEGEENVPLLLREIDDGGGLYTKIERNPIKKEGEEEEVAVVFTRRWWSLPKNREKSVKQGGGGGGGGGGLYS